MAVLKRYVRNRANPEGCMIQGYHTEEVVGSCTDYINGTEQLGVPASVHEGRLCGRGRVGRKTWNDEGHNLLAEVHASILQQLQIITSYTTKHINELRIDNEDKQEEWIMKLHRLHFGPWLKEQSIEDDGFIEAETVKMLARGPATLVTSWQGYDINGWTFYTKQKDMKSKSQNSAICTESLDSAGKKNTYYGFIEDIIELDYGRNLQVPVFKCKWARVPNGVEVDNYGFTIVDFNVPGYKNDPWILASNVAQVFYITDPMNAKKEIVLPGKQRVVGVDNVTDPQEYNRFDDVPPFGDPKKLEQVEIALRRRNAIPYLRTDAKGQLVQGK